MDNQADAPNVEATVQNVGVPVPKKKSLGKPVKIVLIVLLFIASAVGVYFWRDKLANDLVHTKDSNITSLQTDKTKLQKDIEQRDSSITSLQALNATLTAQQKQKDDYITLLKSSNATLAEKEAAATANDTSWRVFLAADSGFSIQFPGIPYKNTFDFTMNGETSPMTYYSRSNLDGYYEVELTTFSDAFMSSLAEGDAKLYVAINNAVGADQDATITSDEIVAFNGQRALKETITIDYGGGYNVTKYGLVFFKGNTLYVIDTSYASQDNFNKFIDSFSLK